MPRGRRPILRQKILEVLSKTTGDGKALRCCYWKDPTKQDWFVIDRKYISELIAEMYGTRPSCRPDNLLRQLQGMSAS